MRLALQLSMPAILAQLTGILLEYIDSAMVGSLGAAASAGIGLITSTTWLFTGLINATANGFNVQIAHQFGAREKEKARTTYLDGMRITVLFAAALGLLAAAISPWLPIWLGGGEDIYKNAFLYFLVFSLTLPIYGIFFMSVGALRCAGNMRIPSIVTIGCCILDVAFNALFIFVLKMGVLGAAIGSVCAYTLGMGVLLWYIFRKSHDFGFRDKPLPLRPLFRKTPEGDRVFRWRKPIKEVATLREALRISSPLYFERIFTCSAQIFTTYIVAPLGTVAIASHAFGITIEGICYMTGFGIADAATTLVGQSLGAKRGQLMRDFERVTITMGFVAMGVMGVLMYVFSPYIMMLMTPDMAVRDLTVECLRIEAFTEPLYGVSIVCYGCFVGAADTRAASWLNLISIWGVRMTLSVWLVRSLGLQGVWLAMAIELSVRGVIFLTHLIRTNSRLNRGFS